MRDDELLGEDGLTPARSCGEWILTALLWGGIAIALHVVLQRMG